MAHTPGRIRDLLVRQFPKCFKRKGAVKLPLKIGIAEDIFKLWSGVEMADIKAGLADYTDGPKYLEQCVEGAHRYDLDGNTVATVKWWEANHSRERLARLRAEWSKNAPTLGDIITSAIKNTKDLAMCGSSTPKTVTVQPQATSQNAFIEPEVDPSLTPAGEAARYLLNNTGYSGAEAFLKARDAANVDFGRRQVVEAETNIQPRTLALLTGLLNAIQSGQKIEAIKLVRAGTGMSLREAKDWVEALQAATPQMQAPVANSRNAKGYMVFRRDQTDYAGSWNLYNTLSHLSDAKQSAESIAVDAASGSEVLLVEILGQTKPVFSMRTA